MALGFVKNETKPNRHKVAKLFHHLRNFGRKALPLFRNQVIKEQSQFVTAAIVAVAEIENCDIRFIMEANDILDNIFTCNNISDVYGNYSLLFSRLVVLMNLPYPKTHGEARLLDPDGTLRTQICSDNFTNSKGIDFLGRMKQQFFKTFNIDTSYVICIFSHYIPCTIYPHMCSSLIYEFANRYNERIIISSEFTHDCTDYKRAWKIMKQSANVFCLSPKSFLPSSDSEKDIESYLMPWDHFDEPPCRRKKKRYKNRTSSLKFYRNTKKRGNSFRIENKKGDDYIDSL